MPTSNTVSEAGGRSLQTLYHIWNSAFTAQMPAEMGDRGVAMGPRLLRQGRSPACPTHVLPSRWISHLRKLWKAALSGFSAN